MPGPIPLNQLPPLGGKKLFGVVWHWTANFTPPTEAYG